MDIDIIDLTNPDYADLSKVQLAMVRAAQAKKNDILSQAEQDKGEFFRLLLSDNVVRSSMRAEKETEIDTLAQAEIDVVRSDLIYQLAYEGISSEGNEYGPYRYPENPNYNLTYPQRFIVVRNYYMDLTSDANARVQAYSMDSLARSYLGEYYQTLYDLLVTYV